MRSLMVSFAIFAPLRDARLCFFLTQRREGAKNCKGKSVSISDLVKSRNCNTLLRPVAEKYKLLWCPFALCGLA